ncbi:MAG TPA: WG repeat-containing protein [Bacillota bacterium]|nr:WG repeat-containing protein [Bacillota bacterium]HQE66287.1 WG repeat-containing protein [Bacillota bacterium]HQJ36526.1 WG repeat-containing protein [Bacillota bacterium]HRS20565.1 WG repeat-containing protein [Clostridia bacterium]
MNRQKISMLLILSMLLTMLPAAALAAAPGDGNYYDSDITWLGNSSEYQKSLSVLFDSGLRKIKVGEKYGLADIYGNWAAEPIYDSIDAHYWLWNENYGRKLLPDAKDIERTDELFADGYVQAVKNGKMGLLDKTGKEVIPCNYDAVGLPVEGICRLTRKSDYNIYIGYWNLELGKEIAAPNKYKIPQEYYYFGDAGGDYLYYMDMPNFHEGRNPAFFDFINGYAMVPTGKTELVQMQHELGIEKHDQVAELFWVQIIDKNGKEILPQPYPFDIRQPNRTYPQNGPYLVYEEISTKRLRMIADAGGYDVAYNKHTVSGVVGEKGVLIPATYHGGINGNSATGWYMPGARMELIPELSMVITNYQIDDRFREGYADRGVVNFNNKIVIPFKTEFLTYHPKYKVFSTMLNEPILRPDGSKIPGTEKRAMFPITENGIVYLGKANDDGMKIASLEGIISMKTGQTYNLKGEGASDVSIKDTIWVNRNDKWGLVTLAGTVLLPFEYDEIEDSNGFDKSTRQDEKDPYMIVKKDGKFGLVDASGQLLLPCTYSLIEWGDENYFNIQDAATGKFGIYNFNTKKITTPCIMPNALNSYLGFDSLVRGVIGGSVVFTGENGYPYLFDLDKGKQVSNQYNGLNPYGKGTFINRNGDYFGPDGGVVFPYELGEPEYLTLVVKNGKIGAISGSRLKTGGKLPTPPANNTPAATNPAPAKPAAQPKLDPSKVKFIVSSMPTKTFFTVGEAFSVPGLVINYQDDKGAIGTVDNSQLKFITSEKKELTPGKAFTAAGSEIVNIRYGDVPIRAYNISISEKIAEPLLPDGNYYIKIFGKYVSPGSNDGINTYYVLSDTKPDKPFTVKFKEYNAKDGAGYVITYNKSIVRRVNNKDGEQIRTNILNENTHSWRITQHGAYYSIRDYSTQKFLVNASGASSDNGTKVTIWTYPDSAPAHGQVKFIKAD